MLILLRALQVLKVIGVKSIIVVEAGSSPPVPVYSAKALDGVAASPTPIISGQQEISASVKIVYLIGYIISFLFFEHNIKDENNFNRGGNTVQSFLWHTSRCPVILGR